MDVLVEACDGSLQMLHRHQHVLDHMVLLVKPSNGLSLGELQQRDFRGNHPPKKPTEHRVVAKWNDILEERHKKQTHSYPNWFEDDSTPLILLST